MESGFTLFELLVVLVVVGVSLAVAAPALPRPRSSDEAAGNAIVRLMEQARRLAADEGADVILELDPAADTYRMLGVAECGAEHELRAGPLSSSGAGVVADARWTRVHVVRFDALGRAVGDPIPIAARTGHVIRVHPWTGRPRVER